MDLVLNIFKQLGADGTFFIQFIIFVVAFLLLKIVLFDKLMFVIEHREKSTHKQIQKAEKEMEEAQKLANEYKAKIDTTLAQTQNELLEQKVTILENQRLEIRKAEENLSKEIELEKELFAKKAEKYKTELFGKSEDLTGQLIDKLTE